MDRYYEKEKSSRKRERDDGDRERKHREGKDERVKESEVKKYKSDKYRDEKHLTKEDRNRDGDRVREQEENKYREEKKSLKDSRSRDGDRVREVEDKKSSDKYRGEKHSLKDDKHRVKESEDKNFVDKYRVEEHSSRDDKHNRDGDRHHRSQNLEVQQEKSIDLPYAREGSRGVREDSLEKGLSSYRSTHKRKLRSESEERVLDKTEKRSRGMKEEKREKRQFGDKTVEDRNNEQTIENDNKELVRVATDVTSREERRERQRFEDRPKEEDLRELEEERQRVSVAKSNIKREEYDQDTVTFNGSGFITEAAALEPLSMKSSGKMPSAHSQQLHPTKVSSISTTNENKGVNVTSFHEVPQKSSTDGTTTSAVGKGGSLSFDAIAKAKKALQKQKEIAEKLKKIPQLNKPVPSKENGNTQVELNKGVSGHSSLNIGTQRGPQSLNIPVPNIEAVKRAQELAAKMGFHHDPEFAPIINMFPGQTSADVSVTQKPAKAPVLRIDVHGREVDEHGNVVNVPKLTNLSTLKVNINKQKKDAFQILKPELDVDPDSNPHFDADMGINKTKLLRPKRMSFQFVEEGKWSKDAEIIKFKSQFGEAQAKELKTKQAHLSKAKAELDINPNLIEVAERVIVKEKPKDPIPEVDWWDIPLLVSGTYADITEENITEDKLKTDKISIYVEHPLPIEPPAEPAPPPPQPLKLTKKEQKKLRTQRRLAKEKDRQEMIRQGLLEPPKPKIKMSNLMKILGSQATQDPTKMEMEVRSAAADREQAHVDRNIARKLTPAERREKKEKKLYGDSSTVETMVSIYKVNDLSDKKTLFKVDVNAQEEKLSGCVVLTEGMCVVVVEGGPKQTKWYEKLMLRRIKWSEIVPAEIDEDEAEDRPENRCVLVWQGSVAKASFYKFHVHRCRTDAAARKVFSDAGVAHYWDLALNYVDEE